MRKLFLKFNSIKINKLSNNNHYLDFYEQKARKMKTYLMKRRRAQGCKVSSFTSKRKYFFLMSQIRRSHTAKKPSDTT